jgi:hypothetical protein
MQSVGDVIEPLRIREGSFGALYLLSPRGGWNEVSLVVCLGNAHSVARERLKTNRAGRETEVNRKAINEKRFLELL